MSKSLPLKEHPCALKNIFPDMFKTRKGLLALILLFLITGGFTTLKNYLPINGGDTVAVSEQARTHILYGDKRGGGHKAGIGKPCKSEFPATWADDDIIDTIRIMAANDNLKWRKQENGYYITEDSIDGIRVRVVLDRERDDVVTAYPLNVKRNACPARKPANDNYNN